MSYDTSYPLKSYQNIFNTFRNEVINIKEQLELSYNFGKSSADITYSDFWGLLVDVSNLPLYNFDGNINNIISSSQKANDIVANNFMNLLGMVSQLDNYICFASDSLSRSIDTAWSFGTGSIYHVVYGEYDDNIGSNVIIKKGLEYYKSELGKILINLSSFYSSMDSSKFNDVDYLTNFRDNYFLPEIRKSVQIKVELANEFGELEVLSDDNVKNLEVWLPMCFRMLTTVSLTFNLGNKIMKIGNKGLIDGSPLSIENRIGMSVAKYWKSKVLPDMSNRGDCMTEALLQGFAAISAPGFMEAFIEKTWDNNVPKS